MRQAAQRHLKNWGPHAYVALHVQARGSLYESRFVTEDPDEVTTTKFNSRVAVRSVNDLVLNLQDKLEHVYQITAGRAAKLVRVDLTIFKGYEGGKGFAKLVKRKGRKRAK